MNGLPKDVRRSTSIRTVSMQFTMLIETVFPTKVRHAAAVHVGQGTDFAASVCAPQATVAGNLRRDLLLHIVARISSALAPGTVIVIGEATRSLSTAARHRAPLWTRPHAPAGAQQEETSANSPLILREESMITMAISAMLWVKSLPIAQEPRTPLESALTTG